VVDHPVSLGNSQVEEALSGQPAAFVKARPRRSSPLRAVAGSGLGAVVLIDLSSSVISQESGKDRTTCGAVGSHFLTVRRERGRCGFPTLGGSGSRRGAVLARQLVMSFVWNRQIAAAPKTSAYTSAENAPRVMSPQSTCSAKNPDQASPKCVGR
jgi:hypothetical protein